MRLFVIACSTRLKVLRLDLCLLFSGRRDPAPPRKRLESPVISISSRHPVHTAIISATLMLWQFTAYQMQLPKLLLGKDVFTVAFNYDII